MEGGKNLPLPFIDLSSKDRLATANLIVHACSQYGFFYLQNHGISDELLEDVFSQSKEFFSIPVEEKTKLLRNSENRGYTPWFSETLDPSPDSKGDLKESFYIGPWDSDNPADGANQWPSQEVLPRWRVTMESYYVRVLEVAKSVISMIALGLTSDESLFEKLGAFPPMGFVRLLHYPGIVANAENGSLGASAHTDYGMITLLATDSVPGLQICRDKDRQPFVWEDVPHVKGAFIVNVGDMLERWTNCFFRSTLHRVMLPERDRYSVAFFCDPDSDCLVKCLETCCSESCPAGFPPIRSGDYLQERFRLTYGSNA